MSEPTGASSGAPASGPPPRRARAVTLVIHRDDARATRAVRIPLWALQAAIGTLVAGALTLAVVLLLYAPIVRAASRVPALERRVRELEAENAQVRQLAAVLDTVQAGYSTLRHMLGADVVPPSPTDTGDSASAAVAARRDSTAAASVAATASATASTTAHDASPSGDAPVTVATIYARAPGADTAATPSPPTRWPLDARGFVTRGQVGAGGAEPDEAHPGVDVAVPVGSAVRAAGGGIVARAGLDTAYGRFVLLTHSDGYASMYGHLSRVVVHAGDTVATGQLLGLSGNSGRSTAPHLHFEIRRSGRTLDPLTLVQEPR